MSEPGNVTDTLTKTQSKTTHAEAYKNVETLKNLTDKTEKSDSTGAKAGAVEPPVPKAARKKSVAGFFREMMGGPSDEELERQAIENERGQEQIMSDLESESTAEKRIELSRDQRTNEFDFKSFRAREMLDAKIGAIEYTEGFKKCSETAKRALLNLKVYRMKQKTSVICHFADDDPEVDQDLKLLSEYGRDLKKIDAGPPEGLEDRKKAFREKYEALGFKEEDYTVLKDVVGFLENMYGNPELEAEIKGAGVLDLRAEDEKFFTKKEGEGKKDDGTTYTYTSRLVQFNGPLFKHDPSAADVKQGDLGDCYFISAVNSVVEKDPAIIRNMMQDNGDHVTVRFYDKDNKPVFVKVKKTLNQFVIKENGVEKDGNVLSCASSHGGALWVSMLEKAYAVARPQIEVNSANKMRLEEVKKKSENPYDCVHKGGITDALKNILGPDYEKKEGSTMSTVRYKATFDDMIDVSRFLVKMREDKRSREADKKKDAGEKLSAVEWNIKKAKLFFGVDIKDETDENYALFAKDDLFKKMESFVNDFVTKNFTTSVISDDVQMLFVVEQLSKQIDKMPELKVKGYDEAKLKRHYLNYLKCYAVNNRFLRKTIKRDGNYSEDELADYRRIENAVNAKKIVSVTINSFNFSMKQGEGQSAGEKIVFGIAGGHGYSIRNVMEEERTIGGKKVMQKFVVLVNPWKTKIRQYDRNGLPYLVDGNDSTGNYSGGIFKMELSDFLHTASFVDFS